MYQYKVFRRPIGGSKWGVAVARRSRSQMGEIRLNPTDEIIVEMLREGRCTPSYIADEHGYSRQNVTNRLNRLVEHGYVTRVHTGLYELSDDPFGDDHKD